MMTEAQIDYNEDRCKLIAVTRETSEKAYKDYCKAHGDLTVSDYDVEGMRRKAFDAQRAYKDALYKA